MRCWTLVLLAALGCSSGCALMDEIIYGDEAYGDVSHPAFVTAAPGCNAPPVTNVSLSQTQEPELAR